ncbi:CsbD family protein [Rhodococcus sp. NPDC056960]|uniref:CsbD family protein n=1 Tax=Rhodococcus sp. NPDC056960 TaxID=3345982 RepID=UPI00362FDD45
MGIVDRAKNATQHAVGKSREKIGRASGDAELERIGKSDQRRSKVKKAGEKIKRVFKR